MLNDFPLKLMWLKWWRSERVGNVCQGHKQKHHQQQPKTTKNCGLLLRKWKPLVRYCPCLSCFGTWIYYQVYYQNNTGYEMFWQCFKRNYDDHLWFRNTLHFVFIQQNITTTLSTYQRKEDLIKSLNLCIINQSIGSVLLYCSIHHCVSFSSCQWRR